MELVSDGSLTSDEEPDRSRHGANVVGLASAGTLTGQESAKPLTELVSADPPTAGVEPESTRPLTRAGVCQAADVRSGSLVNKAAVVESKVEPQAGVGQEADQEPKTGVSPER